MCREVIESIADKFLTFMPLVGKKFLKIDLRTNQLLPVNQLSVLAVLCEEEGLSISEIGKRLHISKPQMTILINNLVKEDFVERIYDKEDRRVIKIELTSKGKEQAEYAGKVFKENISNKLSSLSREKMDQLSEAMETVTNILKDLE